jgi:DNA-binding HxlR family transcriptional regulator
VRPGSNALSQFAVPLNVHVLEALEEEPIPLADLRRSVGHPPVTTMRSYLQQLTKLGVIECHRETGFPGSVSYALTPSGRKLLAVREALQDWLRRAPDGPIELGSTASKSVIKALLDGYEANVVRALAARPLALTELSRLIPSVSYPTLERRLTAMRQVGLVEPCRERNGRVAPYRVTRWLRLALAPMTAAVGWERRCDAQEAPATARIHVEAAFLLAVPLLALPAEVTGVCQLSVELGRGREPTSAGVTIAVEDGQVRSCVSRLEGQPDAWATGSVLDWFRWLRKRGDHQMEIGGDSSLAQAFANGFRQALEPVPSI